MKRLYIITGANGHLASTIIRCLRKEDCLIRGLILPGEQGTDDRQITYYKGDITKPESLEGVFSGTECNEVIVIHAAGIISIGDELTPRMYSVNVEGTKNVIDQCVRRHVKRLVYVSSVHAIPEDEREATIREVRSFSKDAVVGAYAKTKAEATALVLDAAKSGLDAVVVHPSGILGPYDGGHNHLVQLIRMYCAGRLPAGVRGGYDFVDVLDVALGCIQAAQKGVAGECYILSNRYFTIAELLECVRRIVGGGRKRCLPMGLARAFVPFFEWWARVHQTRPLYTRYALYTISGNGHFSHDKAAIALGYQPRDLQETVKDTIAWLNGQSVSLESAQEQGGESNEVEYCHGFELRSAAVHG